VSTRWVAKSVFCCRLAALDIHRISFRNQGIKGIFGKNDVKSKTCENAPERTHNLKVVSSNLAPATNKINELASFRKLSKIAFATILLPQPPDVSIFCQHMPSEIC
jgi:hypothetical protein